MAIKIAFFDCDGTLTTVKSSWEYLHRCFGLWTGNADEYQRLFLGGKVGYEEFCRKDALLWKGFSTAEIESVVNGIPYQAGAAELVGRLRNAGIITVIISTGLSVLVDRVRRELSFDLSFSNDLLVDGGVLSGEIKINVDYDRKGLIVEDLLKRFGLSAGDALAVGDGEGDRGMFEVVGLPVGFNTNGTPGAFPAHTVYVEYLHSIFSLPGVAG